MSSQGQLTEKLLDQGKNPNLRVSETIIRICENMKKPTTLNSTLELNFMIISMFPIIGGKLRKHNSSMGGDHSQNTWNI